MIMSAGAAKEARVLFSGAASSQGIAADARPLHAQQLNLLRDLEAGGVVACRPPLVRPHGQLKILEHIPTKCSSSITARRREICFSMLFSRRLGQRLSPWRRHIFFRTVVQMSLCTRGSSGGTADKVQASVSCFLASARVAPWAAPNCLAAS